jgi:uncharacterized protein
LGWPGHDAGRGDSRFGGKSPLIAGIELWALIALVAAVLVGATLQGVVGLGLGLILAPVTGLVAPQLLPGLALWLAMLLPLFTLTRDWRSTDWWGLSWALAARIPGTAIGVWLVSVLPVRALHILVGVVVLTAVALTVRTVRMSTTPTTLLGAGFISGITGTISSIGGPPLALVLQHQPTDTLRATLGVYFVLGAAFSIVGLSATGQLPARDLLVAAGMTPVVLLGFLLSGPLRRRLDHRSVRIGLLTLCAASAAALVARSLVA